MPSLSGNVPSRPSSFPTSCRVSPNPSFSDSSSLLLAAIRASTSAVARRVSAAPQLRLSSFLPFSLSSQTLSSPSSRSTSRKKFSERHGSFPHSFLGPLAHLQRARYPVFRRPHRFQRCRHSPRCLLHRSVSRNPCPPWRNRHRQNSHSQNGRWSPLP